MKKSLLCILLACVLLLGGCVLTDLPVETEGMVESAEMILDISYLLADILEMRDYLIYLPSSAGETAAVRIQEIYDSFLSEWEYIIQTDLPKCLPYLHFPMPEEPFVTQLLNNCKKAADLNLEVCQKLQNKDATYVTVNQEAVSIVESIDKDLLALAEGWREAVETIQIYVSDSPKLRKVLHYKSLFSYVYNTLSMKQALYRCHHTLFLYLKYPSADEKADLQSVNDFASYVLSLGSQLKERYETADKDLKQLYEPFYTDTVTALADCASQIQTQLERIEIDEENAKAELNQYLENADQSLAAIIQTYIEHERSFLDHFYQLVN